MNRQECMKREIFPEAADIRYSTMKKNDGRAVRIHNRIMAGALYFHCFPAREELTVPDRRL